ncbi:MAG: hypothetical protein FJ291_24320 [Planctomycetes bacterium]|nr:hypothetical protein [Planctomycetota bacterium]
MVEIVGIVIGLLGIGISCLAIWLSVKFYLMGNELYAKLSEIISRIEASSKTTETTLASVTARLIEWVLGEAGRSLRTKAMTTEEVERHRITSVLEDVLKDLPAERQYEVKRQVLEALQTAFLLPRQEASKLEALTSSGASTRPAPQLGGVHVPAGEATHDWAAFVQLLDTVEATNRFVSLKWLHQKKLAGEPGLQQALQKAIDLGIVEMETVENPKNPKWPTRTCRLNRKHPLVRAILSGNPRAPA